MAFDFSKKFSKERLVEFAELLLEMQRKIPFKVSSRGWGYLMEQGGYINKSQFDKVEDNINKCRKTGLIPVDFVAEEDARAFSGVERPSDGDLSDTLQWMLEDVLDGSRHFTPDWWAGEKYYLQVVVEKVDLKTLFEEICHKYHIPIANSKGWSSILQRAEYAERFRQAEEQGLKCVLLYCGDHDPDGLRISDTMRANLEQLSEIRWSNGRPGYDPKDLIIERFGLNYDFIIKNKYTWIDNLITGRGLDLADPKHPNYKLPYLQNYRKTIGKRKCEANAVVTTPKVARELMENTILKYLGKDAPTRFSKKRDAIREEYQGLLEQTGLEAPIRKFLYNEDSED